MNPNTFISASTHGKDDGIDEEVKEAAIGFLTMTWRAPSGQQWSDLEDKIMFDMIFFFFVNSNFESLHFSHFYYYYFFSLSFPSFFI